MSAPFVCVRCRQALRLQFRQHEQARSSLQKQKLNHGRWETLRYFSTGVSNDAPQPQPYMAKPPTESSPSFSSPSAPQTSQFGPAHSIAKEIRKRASVSTETYIAYGVCENLVKECARQADYKIPQRQQKNVDIPKSKDGEDLGVGEGWWYHGLGLTPTFQTWSQVTFLHMYFLTCRLRMFPPQYAQTWHQHLLDHFFYMAEDRMTTQHGIVAGSTRSKYLKDLFVQWRGLMAGYDEGLVKGDAVLATAVWRNLFKADPDVNFEGIGLVVSYLRGVLLELEGIEDGTIASGEVVFGDPSTEREGVIVRSRMMGTLTNVKDDS